MPYQYFKKENPNEPLIFFLIKKVFCGIITITSWQAYDALPQGNVLASHVVGDKRW